MYTFCKTPRPFIRTVEVVEPDGEGTRTQKLKVEFNHLGPGGEKRLLDLTDRDAEIAAHDELVSRFLDVADEQGDPIDDGTVVVKDEAGEPVTLRRALLMQVPVRRALLIGYLQALSGESEGNAA